MKRTAIFIIVIVLLFPFRAHTQEVIISGVNFIVAGDINVNINDMNLSLEQNNGMPGKLYSGGNVFLNSDVYINTASNPFFEYLGQKGTLHFTGSQDSHIFGGVAASMQNLLIDKVSGGLYLNTPLSLTGILYLNNGIIHNDAINTLTLELGAEVNGGDVNSHVIGFMQKVADGINNAFVFPLGTGEYYRPIGFFDLSGPAMFSANHIEDNPEAGWDTDPPTDEIEVNGKLLHRVSNVESWQLEKGEDNVEAKVILSWDDDYSQLFDHHVENPEDLLATVWNGDHWTNLGGSNYDIADKQFDSYNTTGTFGIFTLASSKLPPLPGDVNSDGVINVLDVVYMVNYLNGNPPGDFNEENGVITGTSIDLNDLTALIDIIMSSEKSATDIISDEGHLYINENGRVSFESDGSLTALYFEFVNYNKGLTEIEKLLTSDHIVSFNGETGIGIIYSMSNTPISKGYIELMQLSDFDPSSFKWIEAKASNVSHQIVEVHTYATESETISPEQVADSFDMIVYPNPSSGTFYVDFQIPEETSLQLEVIDKMGRTVYISEPAQLEKGLHTFDLNLSSYVYRGVYFLRVHKQGVHDSKPYMKNNQKIIFY